MKRILIAALLILAVVGILLNLFNIITSLWILTACYFANAIGLLWLISDDRKRRGK